MDLTKYKKITKLFNKYLIHNKTNIYTLSNPILTIINEHSTHTRLFNKNFLLINF